MNDDDILNAMYAPDIDDDDDAPRPQPEQLRLAGRATVIQYGDKNLAVPRIEYVETLEKQVRDLGQQLVEMNARLKKAERDLYKAINIAQRNVEKLDMAVNAMQSRNRPWDR